MATERWLFTLGPTIPHNRIFLPSEAWRKYGFWDDGIEQIYHLGRKQRKGDEEQRKDDEKQRKIADVG